MQVQFLSAESSITCNLPSKSTIFMLNMAFDVLLRVVFVKYSKLQSFVSRNIYIKIFALCFHMYFFFIKS